MPTHEQLQQLTVVPDKSSVTMEMVDFETVKMVCQECRYESGSVSEFDEPGLEAIHGWAVDHVCVVIPDGG